MIVLKVQNGRAVKYTQKPRDKPYHTFALYDIKQESYNLQAVPPPSHFSLSLSFSLSGYYAHYQSK